MTDFKVGDRVAIISHRYGESSHRFGTIDRETKLYWIVGDSKFRKSDNRIPGGDAWTPNANIEHPDSPTAKRAELKQQERDMFARVRSAMDDFTKARGNSDAVVDVGDRIAEALDAYLDVVQKIEAAE